MTLFRLDGKRALVTGGSKGIAFAAAQQLRDLGAEVTIASRSAENVQAAAEQLGVQGLVADVSNPGDIASLLAQGLTAAQVVAATMPQIAPGAIVLAHDIHPWTIKAVPTLIKRIRAKGYTLVSLDDILGKTVPGKTYFRGKH